MPQNTISLILSALFASLPGLPPIALASGELRAARAAFDDRQYLRALTQLRVAADKGNSRAQCISGLMLLYGEELYGVEIKTDRPGAVRYLKEAAIQGDEIATFMLKSVGQSREWRSAGPWRRNRFGSTNANSESRVVL